MTVRFVAEIGQNHNGRLDWAKRLVDLCALPVFDDSGVETPGVDAVKLTKRDLEHELSRDAERAPYVGRHSFGDTYGEHREALELSWTDTARVCRYARDRGLDFVLTLCAPGLVDEMARYVRPDMLKVASRDLSNLPLLDAMARTHLPMVLSTGMHGRATLHQAVEVVTKHINASDLTICHCVSDYPTPWHALNLNAIRWLHDHYPRHPVGFSDHTIGVQAPVAATAIGISYLEKHITLSRNLPGSDHAGALAPKGLLRCVRDVRNVERGLGDFDMRAWEAAASAREKLERSICASSDLSAGTVLGSSNTELLSPGTGVPWTERDRLFGRRLAERATSKTVLSSTMVHR